MTLGRRLSAGTTQKLSQFFAGQFDRYVQDVLAGTRVCGRSEHLKVVRYLDELSRGGSRWTFDREKGMRPLLWMAANLKFPMGEKRGKPFRPEPWQTFDIMDIFGWVDKETGLRRYLQGYWQIAKKNGKSTIGGGVLNYLAFGDGVEGASCVIAANSLEQAGECFSRAEAMLRLAKHDGLTSFNSRTYKIIKWGDSSLAALTAAPKDGKLPHGAAIDEFHEASTSEMVDSILTGNVSDAEAFSFIITTAGFNLEGPCHREYERCKSILEGVANDRYWVSIYETDANDPVESPTTWQKANPNWGVSINEDLMQARFEDASMTVHGLNNFKTKNLNMWIYGLAKWANMAAWKELCNDPFTVSEKSTCYAGLDLAAVSDFAAMAIDFPGDVHNQIYHFWVPQDRVTDLAAQCSIPLEEWVEQGYVTATPGPVIDYSYIASYIEDLYDRFDLHLIAADRWRLNELARYMPDWFTEITFEFSQALKSMSPSIRQFERHYLTGKVNAGGNPVMTWMMGCAEIRSDANENIRLVKRDRRKSAARIDGVIAAIMALDTAVTQHSSALTEDDLTTMINFF